MLGPEIAAALPGMRVQAESLMVDVCSITKDGGSVWDDDLGEYVPGARVVVYAGPCRVSELRSSGESGAGEASQTVSGVVVAVPIVGSESVREGHVVEITAAEFDSELVGRSFTVTKVPAKSHATARRLEVVEVSRDA